MDKGYPHLELKAKARKFIVSASAPLRRLVIFDTDIETDFESLRCVLVGIEKSEVVREKQKHYVLVIRPIPSEEHDAFKRVGVSILEQKYIMFDEQEQDVRIL